MEKAFSPINLDNIGLTISKLSDEDLKPIQDEIEKIQKNFSSHKKANTELAGNIENEFFLSEEIKKYTNDLLLPYLNGYDNCYAYTKNVKIFPHNVKVELEKLWVNFQKKYEFNPSHNHSGLFSFVIWMKVPYYMKDELKNSFGKNSNKNCPGHFEIHYSNTLGKICDFKIPVDKTMENHMLLFPSEMYHGVYPFYTSDDYRISVSGNFNFKI